ncbi:MAG: DNA starvation/stationary phase protection protein [Oligoflexia bacterium]|nr:DNA starvation/stationary phase protection protein [Oligoflexia bacterium]
MEKQTDKKEELIADSLNAILANEFALFTKTLNYHWNVSGPRFHSIHTFLEQLYNEELSIMDELAERIRTIGYRPLSSVKEIQSEMKLTEHPGKFPETTGMLNELSEDNLYIQNQIKDCLGFVDSWKCDPGTEDFLVGLLQKHEKMRWMLRTHIE